MNFIFQILIMILIQVFLVSAFAVVKDIESCFEKLNFENKDLYFSRLDIQMKEQSLKASRSRLWPSLSLSLSGSQGEGGSSNVGAINPNVEQPEGGIDPNTTPPAPPPPDISSHQFEEDYKVNSSWGGQISLGYYVFTRNAISEDIGHSLNALEKAKLNFDYIL